jgi:hypothetical protein
MLFVLLDSRLRSEKFVVVSCVGVPGSGVCGVVWCPHQHPTGRVCGCVVCGGGRLWWGEAVCDTFKLRPSQYKVSY